MTESRRWEKMPYSYDNKIKSQFPYSHIMRLYNIIFLMTDTLEKVSNMLGLETTKEIIERDYYIEERGPNILDKILINRGQYTEEEARRNITSDDLIDTVTAAINILADYGVSTEDLMFRVRDKRNK